jgi:hypothetical protein
MEFIAYERKAEPVIELEIENAGVSSSLPAPTKPFTNPQDRALQQR